MKYNIQPTDLTFGNQTILTNEIDFHPIDSTFQASAIYTYTLGSSDNGSLFMGQNDLSQAVIDGYDGTETYFPDAMAVKLGLTIIV